MGHYPSFPRFSSWFLAFLASIPVSGLTIFYCVFHLGLKIPVAALLEPYIVTAIIHLSFSPAMYWACERHAVPRGDLFPLFLTLSGYSLAISLSWLYYGLRLGVLDPSNANYYYVIVLLCGPGGPMGAKNLHKKMF